MIADFTAPHIDYAGLSPIIALTAGLCIVLIAGVFDSLKRIAPELAILTLGATAGLAIWQWDSNTDLVAGALRLDPLALSAVLIACLAGASPSSTRSTTAYDWPAAASSARWCSARCWG